MSEIIRKHLEAYGASNWDAFKRDLAPDVVYEEVASGQKVKGADNYLTAIQRWKKGFPDLKGTLLRSYEAGDVIVAEVEWAGTHTASLETPFGAIPATNKRGTSRAVLLYQMKNGKIVELRHYYDMLAILMQMGVAPGAFAPGAKPVQPTAQH